MNLKGYILNGLILTIAVSCVGCGGSGGGTSEKETPIAAGVVVIPAVTQDLSASSEFYFNTAREVEFKIKVDTLASQRAFVSVFTDYATINGVTVAKYDSRIVNQEVLSGEVKRNIMITNDVNQVLIQVWREGYNDVSDRFVADIDTTNLVSWNF